MRKNSKTLMSKLTEESAHALVINTRLFMVFCDTTFIISHHVDLPLRLITMADERLDR